MSGMEGNPNVTERLKDFARGSSQPEQASVAATLALAYEQRTANLIAERDGMDMIPLNDRGEGWLDQHDKLQGQINARLGIVP